MTETLLGSTNVLLFGRIVEDLTIVPNEFEVKVATTENIALTDFKGPGPIDEKVVLKVDDKLLLLNQTTTSENGVYTVGRGATKPWNKDPVQPKFGQVVAVLRGKTNKGRWKRKANTSSADFEFSRVGKYLGSNRFLEQQLTEAVVARIYGFTYEGTYYDLPRPTLFVVHGEGERASLASQVGTEAHLTRAPRDPSVSGVGAADFQLAEEIHVWSYDKADYTIRMDVDTGMFEQVLLDAFFDGGGGGGRVSGAMVSGAMVGGPSTRGAMVRGAMVSGAMLRGRRGGRGDPSD